MKVALISIALLALLATAFPVNDDSNKSTPVELGLVQWNRDLEAAQKISESSGRPMLMLFQEVPG